MPKGHKNKECRKQFSTKVGTIFEDSPLGLDKWFVAVWCIANAKNGISSCELARAIKVTQKNAWHILHHVRLAMKRKPSRNIIGEIESDESFIGGKTKDTHKGKRKARGTSAAGKGIVRGLLERGGEIRCELIPNTSFPRQKAEWQSRQPHHRSHAGESRQAINVQGSDGSERPRAGQK